MVEEEILIVDGKAIVSQWVVWLYQEDPSWESVELALLMRSTCASPNLSGQHDPAPVATVYIPGTLDAFSEANHGCPPEELPHKVK